MPVLSSGTYVARLVVFSMTGATPFESAPDWFGVIAYVLNNTTGSPATINYHTFGNCLSLDGAADIAFAAVPSGWRPTSVNLRPTPPTGGSANNGHVKAGSGDGAASATIDYGLWHHTSTASTASPSTQYPVLAPLMPDPSALQLQALLSVTLAVTVGSGQPPYASIARLLEIYGTYDIVASWWTIPALSPCGDRQDSHLQLAAADPGASWEPFDPLDPDAAPTPTITLITPDHGDAVGGTEILIEGSGFGDGCSVAIDGVPCTGLVVLSQSRLRCTTPAHAAGLENVVVTNEDGVTS